jgi:hypothetical protein
MTALDTAAKRAERTPITCGPDARVAALTVAMDRNPGLASEIVWRTYRDAARYREIADTTTGRQQGFTAATAEVLEAVAARVRAYRDAP